jgi:hypothetical protein
MAGGEYVSMSGQREMYQREIAPEQSALEEKPDDEHAELVLIYRADLGELGPPGWPRSRAFSRSPSAPSWWSSRTWPLAARP